MGSWYDEKERICVSSTYQYIQEDIEELEKLKKRMKAGKKDIMAFYDYEQQYLLFLTTLKIAVNNGTLKEYEAVDLKEKYSHYDEE